MDTDTTPTGDAEAPAIDAGAEPDDDKSTRLGDLGAYIRNQRNSAQLSLRNLAKMAGVSNPYLSQIERGLRKPSAEILQAIAKALSISSETLYVKAGILEERDPDDDVENAISRDRYLTEPQRQALVEMYRSFRQLAVLANEDAGEPAGGSVGVEAS
ncbi:MAG: helix-turn-helix transcriptional regulator [Nitriliruptorales bacterium]|nr:helix-turn-helix transcriptional regulator [Nitriliruptorales bacterium]